MYIVLNVYFVKKIVERTEKQLLNKNKTKEVILEVLQESCELIHEIRRKCRGYVDKYGEQIANLILEELGPQEICSNLMLCSTQNNQQNEKLSVEIIAEPVQNENHELSSDLVGGQECVLCEFIMARLETELKNKKKQEEIKTTVHGICKKMPKTIAQNCDKFVDKYGDLIIALVDTLPPKEICTRMNLCISQEFHIDANEEITECGVCHGTVLALYPMIKENNDLSDEEMISEACNSIPAKYYGKCSDLIAYYGESIYNLIKRNTDLSAICQSIGKCYNSEIPLQSFYKIGGNGGDQISNRKKRQSNSNLIVGASKCTWGPSYWCENSGQAKECNTTSWCVSKKMGFAAA